MEQHLTILKKLCDECVVYMNKKHIYTVADGTRELSVIFSLSTDDPFVEQNG